MAKPWIGVGHLLPDLEVNRTHTAAAGRREVGHCPDEFEIYNPHSATQRVFHSEIRERYGQGEPISGALTRS